MIIVRVKGSRLEVWVSAFSLSLLAAFSLPLTAGCLLPLTAGCLLPLIAGCLLPLIAGCLLPIIDGCLLPLAGITPPRARVHCQIKRNPLWMPMEEFSDGRWTIHMSVRFGASFECAAHIVSNDLIIDHL
jgi:hypothetical protein